MEVSNANFEKTFDWSDIYLFKINNGKTIAMRELYSKLTIKTPERRHWRRFGVFIVSFE